MKFESLIASRVFLFDVSLRPVDDPRHVLSLEAMYFGRVYRAKVMFRVNRVLFQISGVAEWCAMTRNVVNVLFNDKHAACFRVALCLLKPAVTCAVLPVSEIDHFCVELHDP